MRHFAFAMPRNMQLVSYSLRCSFFKQLQEKMSEKIGIAGEKPSTRLFSNKFLFRKIDERHSCTYFAEKGPDIVFSRLF